MNSQMDTLTYNTLEFGIFIRVAEWPKRPVRSWLVTRICSHSTWEAEVEGLRVESQPGLHVLSQGRKTKGGDGSLALAFVKLGA